MAFDKATPLVLSGAGGTFDLDFTYGSEPQWINLTPASNGALVIQVSNPVGWQPQFIVCDSEDGEVQVDSDGDLGVVWSADQLMQISIEPTLTEPSPYSLVSFTWSYADRASSVITVALESNEMTETPGGLVVNLSNGVSGDTITFSVIGPTTVMHFDTATLDIYGDLAEYMLTIPALRAGDYYLHVEGASSGGEDIDFAILEEPLSWAGTEPRPDPVAPVTEPVIKWRLFDLRDPEVTWTMVRNPSSWTSITPPNDFTHENTTAPDGQMISWQAGSRPWRLEFTGFCETQEEYDQLVFWSELRRRFWLIDHRNRAWLVTFEHFDAKHRIVPNMPWAHDYTVKALVFKQG